MTASKRFRLEFLGCKVNQYEIEDLREGLVRLGMEEAAPGDACDLYVLNTCSVTEHAGATSRKHVRRALRKSPDARVLVTGCYATSDREVVQAIPGVDRVFDNEAKSDILGHVARDLLALPASHPLPSPGLRRVAGQTRAFVKIEDGCEDNCSFCIIPSLRGGAQSRDPDEIVAEVQRLVTNGHREVVLTGVHLGYFGRGEGPRGAPLCALLRRLARVPGLERLKLSSIEVHEITDEMIAVFASDPVFLPHFHVPLQSGADAVLRGMRRKYNARIFRERLRALRAAVPDPAFSTDVIVGFPGETDEDFAQTVELCRDVGFMKLHVFPYSARPGTPAAELDGHLPSGVIEARKRELLAVGEELAASFRDRQRGKTATCLVEGRRDAASGRLTGLTERYVRVLLEGEDRLMGHAVDVVLGDADAEGRVAARLLLQREALA